MKLRAHDIASAGWIHRLGDGQHPLPVLRITARGIEPLTSDGCVLLHFVWWAQRCDYDAVDVYELANPACPRLRPDRLLMFRPWIDIPSHIDLILLCHDLEAIQEHQLAALLGRIESGGWSPPRAFTHWVVTDDGHLAGEARDLDPPEQPDGQGQHFCYVRLFAMPEMAEWGYTSSSTLRAKELT